MRGVWQVDRGPASVRLLVEAGVERGLDRAGLLAGTGLSEACLDDANAQITAVQELRLTDRLLQLLGRPAGLGWTLGLRYHYSVHGLWGYGLVSSPTVGEALAYALEFLPLSFAYSEVHATVADGELCLRFDEPALKDAVRCFVVERDMAAAVQMLREIIGPDFHLSGLSRRAGPGASGPPDALGLPLAAGVRPQSGAPLNSLRFDAAVLGQRLPLANAITFAMCRQACERQLAQRRSGGSLGRWLVDYLMLAPDGAPPGLGQVAALLGHSERTLKRRLHEEGLSYSGLLAEARQAKAAELLAVPGLALAEIAQRLGYSDASSFSQAYKRWHGAPPGARRGQAALAPAVAPASAGRRRGRPVR